MKRCREIPVEKEERFPSTMDVVMKSWTSTDMFSRRVLTEQNRCLLLLMINFIPLYCRNSCASGWLHYSRSSISVMYVYYCVIRYAVEHDCEWATCSRYENGPMCSSSASYVPLTHMHTRPSRWHKWTSLARWTKNKLKQDEMWQTISLGRQACKGLQSETVTALNSVKDCLWEVNPGL